MTELVNERSGAELFCLWRGCLGKRRDHQPICHAAGAVASGRHVSNSLQAAESLGVVNKQRPFRFQTPVHTRELQDSCQHPVWCFSLWDTLRMSFYDLKKKNWEVGDVILIPFYSHGNSGSQRGHETPRGHLRDGWWGQNLGQSPCSLLFRINSESSLSILGNWLLVKRQTSVTQG